MTENVTAHRFEEYHCFESMKNLHGVSWLLVEASTNGGGNIGGVQSLIFQGENSKSGLNWLYLALALLKSLFWKCGLSPGWKHKIFDRVATMLLQCFLLEGITFWEYGLRMLSLLVFYVAAARKLITLAALLLSSSSSSFCLMVVCIRNVFWTFGWCRLGVIGISTILIYSICQK